jgi:hypothetical protein
MQILVLMMALGCGTDDKAARSATRDTGVATRDTGVDVSEDSAPPPPTDSGDNDAPQDTADSGAGDTGTTPISLSGHPRIVARPGDEALVRAQLSGTGADPHLTLFHQDLYAHIVSSCAATAPDIGVDPINAGATYATAAIARNCATLAWLDGDTTAATKATELLSRMDLHPMDLADLGSDVHLSTALALSIETWDLLMGSGLLVDADAAAEPVLAFTRNMWATFIEDYPFIFWGWQNNHNLKMVAAFGMAGLVFDGEPEAMTWLGYAQSEHDWLLGHVLGNASGGYAEGPYYQNYFAFQSLPYLRAYHRLVGAGLREWPVICATRPVLGCDEHTTTFVGDLWDDATIQAQLTWNRRIRMPDGTRPPFDDSVPVGFPSGVLSAMDPSFTWDWTTQASPHFLQAGDMSAEILFALSGGVAEPTESASFTSAETGVAVLATGHGPDATWAMLLGESDPTTLGGGHEHPDAGTLQFYARGVYMAIDSGYPGWTDHEATNTYADHNGVMVGGAPPATAESGDLSVAWTLDAPEGRAEVALAWPEADWTRNLALSPDKLVVRDTIAPTIAATVAWRLHLQTGVDRGSFEPTSWGGIARWPEAALAVVITGNAALSIGHEIDQDALTYGVLRDHDVITATTAAVVGVQILAVLQVIEATAMPDVSVTETSVTIDGVSTTR